MDKKVITIELEIDGKNLDSERLADFILNLKVAAQMMPDFIRGSFHVPCVCTGLCKYPEGTKLQFDKDGSRN